MKRHSDPKLRLFSQKSGAALRWSLAGAFFVFCFFYGATFALLVPYLTFPHVFILAVAGLLLIWALPEAPRAPVKTLGSVLFLEFGVKVMWPSYLAFSLPGWPYISPQLVTQIIFALFFTISFSISPEFRSNLTATLKRMPWLSRAVFLFVLIQLLSVLWSMDRPSSLYWFIKNLITWLLVFLGGCVFFAKKGTSEKMAAMLLITGALVCVSGVWESRVGHVPWAGHIPSWLPIQDENAVGYMSGTERGGVYRVQGTCETSLTFAEFLSMVFLFAIHFVVNGQRRWIKFAAALAMPLIVYVILLTQSRLGLIGVLMTCMLYPLGWALLRLYRKTAGMLTSAVVYLSPIAIGGATAAAFFVGRIRNVIFGSGVEQFSTESRFEQLHMGIPKIISHPWGYGVAQGGAALDYHLPGGVLTIDSYWLRLALEYGPIGLLVFICIPVAALFYAARGALAADPDDRELRLLLPLGCALVEFIVIRFVFAQEQNVTFVFLFLSMIAALSYRAVTSGSVDANLPAKGTNAFR